MVYVRWELKESEVDELIANDMPIGSLNKEDHMFSNYSP